MDKPVQAEGAHLAPTDFAAKRRRKSFAAYFRMRGTDALVPGFNGTVLADLFLAAGYVDGRHVNEQCLAEPMEKFVWRCTEFIKIPAAVAERLYDENPRVLPVAPPAADSSGSVSVKKTKRLPRNLWHVVLVPQPAQPSTIQLATDVWLKRRAMPSNWTEIATRCILGKQLHSLKTQKDGMRYNSDAIYDPEATGIITEQCNDMLGITCCSIALCTALLTTTKAEQQEWHIDDEDKTYSVQRDCAIRGQWSHPRVQIQRRRGRPADLPRRRRRPRALPRLPVPRGRRFANAVRLPSGERSVRFEQGRDDAFG